jgi:long-chain acyl-CoA synthetase
MRGLQPEEIARQLRRRHVTALIAVPKILDLLRQDVLHRFSEAAQPDSAHWTRRWLRFRRIHRHFGWRFWAFISGGAPLSLDTEDFWRKLGFPVIQGYGLTETAPIVAFNNPFAIQRGSAGAVVAGTDVRLAEDGEILVRGANVSSGYWNAPADAEQAFRDGWFHTGDIGEWDTQGHLLIRGRKKEWIVLPDGQKVFPDDVERILLQIPGVLEAAIVGRDHVHAVLVLDASKDPDDIASKANSRLESHQRIHQVSIWPQPSLPRTEATHKIKRAAIQKWLDSGVLTPATVKDSANLVDIVRQHAPGRSVSGDTTLDDLGLSSLERVELLVDLEQHLGARLEEAALAGTSTVNALQTLPAAGDSSEFPVWNRTLPARGLRRALLTPFLLPLAKLAAHITVSGHEHFARLDGPVIFASNHQSHLDTPVILAALPSIYRHRTAVAMWKEYFDAHFSPSGFSRWRWLTNTVSYFLATSLFNGFPLPQTEAGASQSLRYIGELVSDGWSILYFPEGERTESGEVGKFQPGIGFLASRLRIPVVPIRLTGVDRVLHRGHRLPQPGPVRIAFGAPVKLEGNDFANLAERIRSAVLAI